RDDAQLQVLFDLRAVRALDQLVHRWDGALLETDAESDLRVLAETEQILPADGRAVEVAHLEQQRLAEEVDADAAVRIQHVAGRTAVLTAQREVAERDAETVILGRRRRRGQGESGQDETGRQ